MSAPVPANSLPKTDSPPVIRFTDREVQILYLVAGQRRATALELALSNAAFEPKDGDYERLDVRGAAAEMAVAIYLDRYWYAAAYGLEGEHDVAGCQVRHVTRDDYGLLMYEKDRRYAHQPYILVVVDHHLKCTLMGWLYGREGLEKFYWRRKGELGARADGYWIPQSVLSPVCKLPVKRSMPDA